VIKHIVVVEDVFRGCGSAIFVGFRRLASAICVLVVRFSQIGALSVDGSSESLESKRDTLPAGAVIAAGLALLTLVRSAFEAFRVCEKLYIRRGANDLV